MNVSTVRILLAEDNDDDVVLIKEALQDGHLLNLMQIVSDGEQALAYLRREAPYKDAEQPGLVLLDINMPKKNGFEVLDAIKADPKLCQIPVVMLTSSGREEEVVTAYSKGACSFIRKPVSFDEFQQVIKQFALYWALVATIPHRTS